MSWLDFIGNIGTNIKEGMGNVANKIRYANAPQIQPLQMAENGGIDAQKTLELALAQPKTSGERLGGRTVNVDFESSNPETGEIEVNRVSKYQPGLLNDIRSGAKENFATGFAAPNWEQTVTPDGRKKGMGYRFGEGLGSFARFAESPLGRGLIMAGIVGASGGSGLEALGYGAGAGLGNQQARMKDSIYRNSLIEQGQNSLRNTAGFAKLDPAEQQAQLDRIANQVNSYRGYLGDDTYKQVLAGMQLRDNAEYRNALLKGQRLEQDALLAQKQAELQHKKMSEAADRALKSRELDIKEYQALNEGKETQNNEQKLNEMQAQLDDFVSTFDLVDNPYRYRIAGGVSNVLNTLTPEEANFNAKRTLLFNAIARKLADEKGVLSDQDIKRIDDALPKLADTKKQKMAKMGATYSLLDIRRGYKTPQAQVGNTTKSGVKYEVID
jgi:hypothetical protein